MNVAIVGYGKMGRMIESLARIMASRFASPRHRLDSRARDASRRPSSSQREAVETSAAAALQIPVVCGTGHGSPARPRARGIQHQTALVQRQLFHRRERVPAPARPPRCSKTKCVRAWEIHHRAKKDAPSGTLLQLTAAMRAAGYTRGIDESSSRAGAHPGTHEIGFDSAADTITLRHTARSREGFARGALKAATWIKGKQGVHAFADVLFGNAK
jgi:4-hydroxy-tetrahydrodipicolinate reductase